MDKFGIFKARAGSREQKDPVGAETAVVGIIEIGTLSSVRTGSIEFKLVIEGIAWRPCCVGTVSVVFVRVLFRIVDHL